MPAGVDVIVDGGVATIDFVDRSLLGPGLAKLLSVAPAELVHKRTRGGPRPTYVVPEEYARAAGLLDDADIKPAPADSGSQTYDDGLPDSDWRRPAIDAWALEHLKLDTSGLPNKGEALAAIDKARSEKEAVQQPE